MPASVWRCVHAPGDQYLPSLSIALHPSPHQCQPADGGAPSAADRPAGGPAAHPEGTPPWRGSPPAQLWAQLSRRSAGTASAATIDVYRGARAGDAPHAARRRFENRATMRCLGGSGGSGAGREARGSSALHCSRAGQTQLIAASGPGAAPRPPSSS